LAQEVSFLRDRVDKLEGVLQKVFGDMAQMHGLLVQGAGADDKSKKASPLPDVKSVLRRESLETSSSMPCDTELVEDFAMRQSTCRSITQDLKSLQEMMADDMSILSPSRAQFLKPHCAQNIADEIRAEACQAAPQILSPRRAQLLKPQRAKNIANEFREVYQDVPQKPCPSTAPHDILKKTSEALRSIVFEPASHESPHKHSQHKFMTNNFFDEGLLNTMNIPREGAAQDHNRTQIFLSTISSVKEQNSHIIRM
jgi:hypothetical protein